MNTLCIQETWFPKAAEEQFEGASKEQDKDVLEEHNKSPDGSAQIVLLQQTILLTHMNIVEGQLSSNSKVTRIATLFAAAYQSQHGCEVKMYKRSNHSQRKTTYQIAKKTAPTGNKHEETKDVKRSMLEEQTS